MSPAAARRALESLGHLEVLGRLPAAQAGDSAALAGRALGAFGVLHRAKLERILSGLKGSPALRGRTLWLLGRRAEAASVLSGAKYDSIKKELLIHSQEEMQHAVLLSDQIDYLGGKPTIDVEMREISKDSRTMLKQDLAGEENAIRRYKERIAQAEALREYGLRRTLEGILLQEEEHWRDIMSALED